MIHDIFSPPVASRIYAYPNIGAYEIVASKNDKYNSLSGQVNGLYPIPKYENSNIPLNTNLAALIAFIDISRDLIFSEERLTQSRDSLYNIWKTINPKEFENAKIYALKVSNHIKKWVSNDNYKQTRTMPKFTIETTDPSRWQPTPPAYMESIEPHWNKIRPFIMSSSSQFKPLPPPKFSLNESSLFFKELKEVYDIRNELTSKSDNCEEVQIAKFWDCNPYASASKGHLMFSIKKITPGAHWIGITKIANKQIKNNFEETVFAYTKTSIAIADAFISCWDEKYRSNLIRPETLINKHLDKNWKPILQTPPFPEYTSGHSVVSSAAATVLTSIFGEKFAFNDDTELQFGLPIRTFSSFKEAANEAAMSRMYGGIHYRAAVEVGIEQGRNLGNFLVSSLRMKK